MFDVGCTATEVAGSMYGCELDPNEAEKCRDNLSELAREYGYDIASDQWNIVSSDAFIAFDVKSPLLPLQYDYCIMNPPYVRIHNLSDVPDFRWIDGMCDFYYAFYDLLLRLIKDDGKVCVISPSSWMSAKTGRLMRQDLQRGRDIEDNSVR